MDVSTSHALPPLPASSTQAKVVFIGVVQECVCVLHVLVSVVDLIV